MTYKPKILAFAGSLRKDSTNKKLARIAARAAQLAGAEVTLIDLLDYPLPLYNGDIEEKEGLPENALKLKKLMESSDGFIIASPEYNSSFSAVLKNIIDWTSRKANADEVFLSSFIDKAALLLSASPSPLGGLRGLAALRSLLENIYTIVLPRQKTIPNAMAAFDSEGNLINKKDREEIEELTKKLTNFIRKMKTDPS